MKEKNKVNHSELFEKVIWTVKDVIQFTGMSKATVYRLTSSRMIPVRKKGNKLFFFPKEILNWIDEGDI